MEGGNDKYLVNGEYPLEKYPGKGGWTYAAIPEISQNKENPFGWVVVSGWIDDHPLDHYKLMPMGNGSLFLPVKADIRKKIGKQAGDAVWIRLYPDDSPMPLPRDIMACFENEPVTVYERFLSWEESQKKRWIDRIMEARTDETRVSRILEMMNLLGKHQDTAK